MSEPPDALDLSLNEVEQLAQKAARGAGLPWGIAEDTGRAAAWIASRVGPWAATLLALLESPPPTEQSPLLLAGLLADSAAPVRLACVVSPLWSLPGLLATTRRPVLIHLDGASVGCNPGEEAGATITAAALAAIDASALALSFAAPAALPHPLTKRLRRSPVPEGDWRRLTALAFLTYVPATEHSRLTGAGAGLLDDE